MAESREFGRAIIHINARKTGKSDRNKALGDRICEDFTTDLTCRAGAHLLNLVRAAREQIAKETPREKVRRIIRDGQRLARR